MTVSIILNRVSVVATAVFVCLACGSQPEPPPPASKVKSSVSVRSFETDKLISAQNVIEVRAVTHLPIPDKLTLYALEPARISVAAVDEPRNTPLQDDNLLTHVTCAVQEGAPCEIDVRFKKPVTVSAVRLFSGDGGTRKAYKASGRAARVRVGTDQGEAEANLENHWDFTTIQLSQPVKTASVRLSVLDIYGPKKTASVTLSELDVLGVEGPARLPLRLNRTAIYTKADGLFWRGDKFADAWMEQTDLKGNRQRLFRGSQVYGAPKQRFYLAERLAKASCPGAMYYEERRYTVVDTVRRMFYSFPQPVAGLETVSLRRRGEGFFFKGYDSQDRFILRALTFDGESVRVETLSDTEDNTQQQQAVSLGFSEDVLRYDAPEPNILGAAVPCRPLKKRDATVRKAETLLKLAEGAFVDDGRWETCTVSGDRTVYLLGEVCSEEAKSAVVVRLKNGEIVAQAFSEYGGLELRVTGDGSVRISAERKAGAGGDIYDLQEDGTLKKIIPDALFSPGVAPGCRCSA